MKEKEIYDVYTFNSKNPFARFSHRQRLKKSIGFSGVRPGDKVLDYGCGDGRFLHSLELDCKKIGYEPYMKSLFTDGIQIYSSLDDIRTLVAKNGKFDVIVCFEVLEHFNEKNQSGALSIMRSLLKENGTIVLSVPIEIGLATILKNLRRRMLHYSPIYSAKNIFKSVLGLSLKEHRADDGYLTHMGFNHEELEQLLKKNFHVLAKMYSPFPLLSYNFNSQVFYRLRTIKEQENFQAGSGQVKENIHN